MCQQHLRGCLTSWLAQIAEAISFLEKQGVTGDDLPKVLKQFPQVMGLKPDSMKGNINKMEKQYFVRGPALKNVIKRKPQALGFNWVIPLSQTAGRSLAQRSA